MDRKKILIIVGSISIILVVIMAILTNNKKPITYNITFETSGGSIVESQTVNEGERVQRPTDPTRDGYNFVEWTYQGTVYNFSNEVTKDLVLTAKWAEVKEDVVTFVVKFNTDGGTTISNQIIEKGNKIQKPEDPTKEGYIFKGWFFNDESYNFDKVLEENIELKAKWEEVKEEVDNTPEVPDDNKPVAPVVKKYTVTFNSNGGTSVGSQSINEGTTISKPSNPTKDGYTFVEWQLNGKTYNFSSKVSKNIELKAVWKELTKYTVSFNSDGGTNVSSQNVYEGTTVSKPSNPTKDGYTFVEWQLNGSTYNFSSAVSKNIELKAVWKKLNKYTVSFNSDGGTNVSSQSIIEGSNASKPSNPLKDGYDFVEWQLNGSTYNFTSSVTGNIELTAKWKQKNYVVEADTIDATSPFLRTLSVYENGKKITVKTIQYSDGVTICSGANPNVNYHVIKEETTLKLILQSGNTVTATLKIN